MEMEPFEYIIADQLIILLSTYPVSGRIAPLQLFTCTAIVPLTEHNSPIDVVNTVVMCGAIDSISSSPFPLEIDMCPHALVCVLLHYDCTRHVGCTDPGVIGHRSCRLAG